MMHRPTPLAPGVDYRREGAVAVVSLNRPEKHNAIDPAMAGLLEAAVDRLEQDPEVRVGILRAEMQAGRPVFCSGHDLVHFRATFGTPEEGMVSTARGGFAGITRRERTKPLIAAVDGLATAGGWEIVLACDIVIATARASFAAPEVRWNLVATGGAALRLPRTAGRHVAADLLLTGQPISGARAHELGLVSRLAEPGLVDDLAMEVALAICANGPAAVAQSRALAQRCADPDEAAGWALLEAAEAEVRQTDDLREGLRAFGEKRAPRWTGR